MLISLVFGFIFGLIVGTTEQPWGLNNDWPTEEMKGRYAHIYFLHHHPIRYYFHFQFNLFFHCYFLVAVSISKNSV